MQNIRKWFGGIEMTWPRVLLLAVATAAYTALINQVPFLYDTSLRDIAVMPEAWVLFAVFITINCRTPWEAGLKCFVFFLVSQPLIYLIEVPFSGWEIMGYYRNWIIPTILTLPGGAIAWLVKKKGWLGTAVLSVANVGLAALSVHYADAALHSGGHHALSSLFCLGLAVFFTLVLLTEKKHRTAALALIAAVMIGGGAYMAYGWHNCTAALELGSGTWSYTATKDGIVSVTVDEDGTAHLKGRRLGSTVLRFTDAAGKERAFDVTASRGSLWISERE